MRSRDDAKTVQTPDREDRRIPQLIGILMSCDPLSSRSTRQMRNGLRDMLFNRTYRNAKHLGDLAVLHLFQTKQQKDIRVRSLKLASALDDRMQFLLTALIRARGTIPQPARSSQRRPIRRPLRG